MSLSVSLNGLPLARFTCSRLVAILYAQIKIVSAKWVAALAMRLCSAFSSRSFYSWSGVVASKSRFVEKSNLKRPALCDTTSDYILTHASLPRPILSDHADAHEFDPDISATIAILLVARNPFAVLRCVVAIIIKTLKAITLWSRTHISTKVPESNTALRFSPTTTNCDAASSVSMKIWSGRQIASTKHVFVKVIKSSIEFWRFAHAV